MEAISVNTYEDFVRKQVKNRRIPQFKKTIFFIFDNPDENAKSLVS